MSTVNWNSQYCKPMLMLIEYDVRAEVGSESENKETTVIEKKETGPQHILRVPLQDCTNGISIGKNTMEEEYNREQNG